MTGKQALRRELLALRNAIALEDRQAWDAAVNRAIVEDGWFGESQAVLAYCPIGSEPDIKPALEEALRQGKRVFLPRCNPVTREMAFHRIASFEGLNPGAHGIPEPGESNCALRIANGALCLVPAVAFDKAGFRLGYGGGYYDRFLARRRGLRTLGICYEILLRGCLPKSATDIPVERVLTEGEAHER
ncbi:MAG: 5-formyltetrahydrofolate cyclo-ligase [Oscillospiraceae bacterium]|jgi:5-formyltetrahydrofolate cyclo-ligase|nr:5-formyltetrahydrofolate cyclo-ligase [Oscillospiraceae bacterium]